MHVPPEYYDEAYWAREIAEAIETSDPSLSNRRITLVHYRLSQVLHAVTGTDAGANFHTWAVWGSRKAGVTIRQEDLTSAIRNATVVAGIVGLIVGLGVSSLAYGVAMDHRSTFGCAGNVLRCVNWPLDCDIQSTRGRAFDFRR